MTFASRETSRSLGKPDTLMRFESGSTVYAYTDSENPITFDGVTYLPVPLDRDSVTSSGNLDKTILKITLPVSAEIVELFRVFPPSEVVKVIVLQGHDGETEFLAVWSGVVLSCARAKSKAALSCQPVSMSMKRPGLRRRFQYGCPHLLYGPYCRLTRADFTVTANAISVSGSFLTMADGWQGAFSAARFVGGIIVIGDAVRSILQVAESENILVIGGPVAGFTAGSVSLSLGCAHNLTDCGLFENVVNFGGHPWIPSVNPVGVNAQFY